MLEINIIHTLFATIYYVFYEKGIYFINHSDTIDVLLMYLICLHFLTVICYKRTDDSKIRETRRNYLENKEDG